MSIKTILAVLTSNESVGRIMPLAIDLAERNDAHLIGVHAEASAMNYATAGMSYAVKEFAALREAEMRLTEEVKAGFLAATAAISSKVEWRLAETEGLSRSERLVEHARSADLVIMPQAEQFGSSPGANYLQEKLVRECGRSVLVIPHSGKFASVGAHALVGLSPTRESTRAAHDAINLLGPGAKATIITAHRPKDQDDLPLENAKEMARTYSRHGIDVNVQDRSDPKLSPGDVLLNESFERGCDFIVVGAYGHSRVYDMLVGATTTHLMDHMTSPVLFSA